MWPAEFTTLEFASPLHLAVSLVSNNLQANQHTRCTHTQIQQKSERDGWTGKRRKGKWGVLFAASLLMGFWFCTIPPKVMFRESVCVCVNLLSPLPWLSLLPEGLPTPLVVTEMDTHGYVVYCENSRGWVMCNKYKLCIAKVFIPFNIDDCSFVRKGFPI